MTVRLCKDCKYIVHNEHPSLSTCSNVEVGTPDLVYGTRGYCDIHRRMDGKCGPNGNYFEPKPIKEPHKSWWAKLKEWGNERF